MAAHSHTPAAGHTPDPTAIDAAVRPDALPPAAARAFFVRHGPNALTLLRVVLAIGFFVALSPWGTQRNPAHLPTMPAGLSPVHLVLAAIVFILAALTDALDGYLARRWNVVTRFGRVMDPFADKLLILGSFVFLAGPAFSVRINDTLVQVSGVTPWMVVAILGRELLVTSIRAALESEGIAFPADKWGKVKMLLQSVCVPTVLGAVALLDLSPGTIYRWGVDVLVWTTVGVTILSGWPYCQRALRAFSPARTENDPS